MKNKPKDISGEGVVENRGNGIGLKTANGTIWYPSDDLCEMEGETVRVTINRIKKSDESVIGFKITNMPKHKKPKPKK